MIKIKNPFRNNITASSDRTLNRDGRVINNSPVKQRNPDNPYNDGRLSTASEYNITPEQLQMLTKHYTPSDVSESGFGNFNIPSGNYFKRKVRNPNANIRFRSKGYNPSNYQGTKWADNETTPYAKDIPIDVQQYLQLSAEEKAKFPQYNTSGRRTQYSVLGGPDGGIPADLKNPDGFQEFQDILQNPQHMGQFYTSGGGGGVNPRNPKEWSRGGSWNTFTPYLPGGDEAHPHRSYDQAGNYLPHNNSAGAWNAMVQHLGPEGDVINILFNKLNNKSFRGRGNFNNDYVGTTEGTDANLIDPRTGRSYIADLLSVLDPNKTFYPPGSHKGTALNPKFNPQLAEMTEGEREYQALVMNKINQIYDDIKHGESNDSWLNEHGVVTDVGSEINPLDYLTEIVTPAMIEDKKPKKKKKKGPGIFKQIGDAVDDLNLFRAPRYKGARIVGKRRSRSGPSFKYRGGRGGGRRRN